MAEGGAVVFETKRVRICCFVVEMTGSLDGLPGPIELHPN